MHSPLSSSDDDINLHANDVNDYVDERLEDSHLRAGQKHHRRHHKHYKERKHRKHRHKYSVSQAEHSSSSSSRHRHHRSQQNYDSQYDFEPKPQIMSSKPLVQYDDVSENDDIDINLVFISFVELFLHSFLYSFSAGRSGRRGGSRRG